MDAVRLPGKCVKEPSSLCVPKHDSQARHERRVENYGADFVAGGQVHSRHRANTLPVQDYCLGTNVVPGK